MTTRRLHGKPQPGESASKDDQSAGTRDRSIARGSQADCFSSSAYPLHRRFGTLRPLPFRTHIPSRQLIVVLATYVVAVGALRTPSTSNVHALQITTVFMPCSTQLSTANAEKACAFAPAYTVALSASYDVADGVRLQQSRDTAVLPIPTPGAFTPRSSRPYMRWRRHSSACGRCCRSGVGLVRLMASGLPRVLLGEQGDEVSCDAAVFSEIETDALSLLRAAALDVELSLSLCDAAFITQQNKRWRGVDQPTDVLSFPVEDDVMIGDVLICVDVAQRQAQDRGHTLRDELRVLLVHGVLHLCGYDHETDEADAVEMAAAETKLMRRLHWKGNGLIVSAGAVDDDGDGDVDGDDGDGYGGDGDGGDGDGGGGDSGEAVARAVSEEEAGAR